MAIYEDLLVSDFQQCFEQMRHYDEAFARNSQFAVTGIVAVLTACAALSGKYGLTASTAREVAIILIAASFTGVLLILSAGRNRVYFSRVARFVNEVRGTYLDHKPGGFSNRSKMYTDYRFPAVLSLGSSQTIETLALCIYFGAVFALGVAAVCASFQLRVGGSAQLCWGKMLLGFAGYVGCSAFGLLFYWKNAAKKPLGQKGKNDAVGTVS